MVQIKWRAPKEKIRRSSFWFFVLFHFVVLSPLSLLLLLMLLFTIASYFDFIVSLLLLYLSHLRHLNGWWWWWCSLFFSHFLFEKWKLDNAWKYSLQVYFCLLSRKEYQQNTQSTKITHPIRSETNEQSNSNNKKEYKFMMNHKDIKKPTYLYDSFFASQLANNNKNNKESTWSI